jgi:hypothetical protein
MLSGKARLPGIVTTAGDAATTTFQATVKAAANTEYRAQAPTPGRLIPV